MYPQPIGNKLLAKPIRRKEEIIGSIIIPGVANANLEEAEVVAVSDELKEISVGDVVVFAQGNGLSQTIKGEGYLWLQIGEIWAKKIADAA